ncbi:hypothetical protein PR048_006358 [Dryococelus australis]|uniref:Uncharacterized protein n=1 Tax=Dryococelus australis TaxID=614101 RepID=A0ABQ9IAV9_9NEOP|nr:hypothetical protein PR048_006358 [Dryococelus australis]
MDISCAGQEAGGSERGGWECLAEAVIQLAENAIWAGGERIVAQGTSCLGQRHILDYGVGSLEEKWGAHPKMRSGLGELEERRSARSGDTGEPREYPPTRGIIRPVSHLRKCGSHPTGDGTRFALVGGEQSNLSANATPGALASTNAETQPCMAKTLFGGTWNYAPATDATRHPITTLGQRARRVVFVANRGGRTSELQTPLTGMCAHASLRTSLGFLPRFREPMSVIEASMKQRRNEGAGETGDPQENPPDNLGGRRAGRPLSHHGPRRESRDTEVLERRTTSANHYDNTISRGGGAPVQCR